jgi:tight adherence protein B
MIMLGLALAVGSVCWALMAWKDRRLRFSGFPKPAQEPPSRLRDYGVYRLSLRQRCVAVVGGGTALAAIGYLFYSNFLVSALGFAGGFAFPRLYADALRARRLQSLRVQFKQALQALSSSLSAGKSIEQAFADAVQDLRMLYPEGSCFMIEELEIVLRKLNNGGTAEAALADFSRRSGLDDALYFADVFAVCKRTGGNLIEIVRRTSAIIGDKLEIEQDIAVLLAQKKFEARVLLASPVVIIGILKATAADYMAPLYAGSGRVTMTAALALLIVCLWLTRKLMEIKL